MAFRWARVDRSLTPEQTIEMTGRKLLVELDVVSGMPHGEGEWTQAHFFKPAPSAYDADGILNDEALEVEYEKRGFKPADMYSVMSVDKTDPSLTLRFPFGTHWKDDAGNWCHGAVVNYNGERRVHVNRSTRGWKQHWHFAGIPK